MSENKQEYSIEELKIRTSLTAIMYNIMFMNDVAVSYVFDTLEELKKLPLYKGIVKYRVKITESYMKQYNAELAKRSKNMTAFIADVNDEMQELISGDLQKLEFATRNILQKHHVPNVDLMTKLSIAVTLLDASCHNAEYATHFDYKNVDVNYYSRRFRWLKLTKVNDAFKNLSNIIEKENSKLANYNVDLRKYIEIDNGFTIVVEKLKDVHNIFKILNNMNK